VSRAGGAGSAGGGEEAANDSDSEATVKCGSRTARPRDALAGRVACSGDGSRLRVTLYIFIY
jgi:hypothetical protein